MKIQRNFYDELKADMEQSEHWFIAEDDMQRNRIAAKKALQKLEEKVKRCKKVLNLDKCKAFEDLTRRALDLARLLHLNITAQTMECEIGFIVLESDMFVLYKRDGTEYAQTIAELFTTADDIIYFIPDGALPQIGFTFILYDVVER